MEDEPNLRRLVMKKAAAGRKSPLISSAPATSSTSLVSSASSYTDPANNDYSQGYGGEPLIQQIGPDFSKLSRELNRVVLKIQHQAEVSADCPMHNHDPTESRRGSRAPADFVRRRSNESDHYQEHRRSLSGSIIQSSGSRMGSRDGSSRGALIDNNYQSLPRKLNKEQSSKVDRRQSFQDYKTFRDKFVGKVDFKDTLRRGDEPKRPDRARERERGHRGRHYSESRDYVTGGDRGGGGYLIESDFDFRSPPSTRDNSRDRKSRYEYDDQPRRTVEQQIYASPRRGQEDVYATPRTRSEEVYSTSRRKELRIAIGDQNKRSQHDIRGHPSPGIRSPVYDQENYSIPKDPLSPRRVEFADEVFAFKSSRPGSRCESPLPKSILRHTNSDSSSQSRSPANAAVRSNTSDLSFCQSPPTRPTTLIIPTDGSPSFSTQHFNNQISINHLNQEQHEPAAAASKQKPGSQKQQLSAAIDESSGKSGSRVSINTSDGPRHSVRTPETSADATKQNVEQADVDSDETLTEEPKVKKEGPQEGGYEDRGKRLVPPPLADWNRSQSFPQGNGELSQQLRKTSDPIGLSTYSLDSQNTDYVSDIDLIRSQNNTLRTRVGDLERQVVDNNNEIKCLKATLAECLRRIDEVETHTRYCPRIHDDDAPVKRRPLSSTGVYTALESRGIERRGSYGTRS